MSNAKVTLVCFSWLTIYSLEWHILIKFHNVFEACHRFPESADRRKKLFLETLSSVYQFDRRHYCLCMVHIYGIYCTNYSAEMYINSLRPLLKWPDQGYNLQVTM